VDAQRAVRWKQDYLDWIIADDITFQQATSPRLRLVVINGGSYTAHLLPGRTTLSSWIKHSYRARKLIIRKRLVNAKSKINLSFDLWAIPNGREFAGITRHWINKDMRNRTALLGLRRISSSHSGEAVTKVILEVIEDYEIKNKLGAFQLDNASNNRTCVEALATSIPSINPDEHQMSCFGHIVNLVVKAVLFGKGMNTLQKELAGASNKGQFDIWRNQGPIGKLHNIVVYVNRSESRQYAFHEAQRACSVTEPLYVYKLVADSSVRWNSTFDMIERGLKLKSAIGHYLKYWRKPDRDGYNIK